MNSLGESLRMVLSGFGGRQALVMVWHPSVLKVIDNFHLHRPPMVWPSLGPELAKWLDVHLDPFKLCGRSEVLRAERGRRLLRGL